MIPRRTFLATTGGLILAPHAFAQTARIPFEHVNGKIFAAVTVNGQPVQAMIDSGSVYHGVDTAFAERAGIEATGRRVTMRGVQKAVRGRLGQASAIAVGSQTLANPQVIVIDYGSLAATVGRPIEMALGIELFRTLVVELDFAARTLALHDPASFAPPSGLAPTTLTPRAGLMTIPVGAANGRTLSAFLDTGSEAPLIVSPGAAERAGLLSGKLSTAPIGGIGGPAIARVTSAQALSVGGARFEDVPVQIPQTSLGADANLGLGLISRFHAFLDFGRGRAWLQPTGPALFKRDMLGFYGVIDGDRIRVTHVAPGSPAAAAGFATREIITAINGQPAALANQALRDAGAGTALTFTVAGGKVRTLTLARYY